MRFLSFALLTGLVLSGCEAPGEKPVRVEGRVLLDGIPLGEATVTFIPRTPDGRRAQGETGREGNFLLTTFQENDGALPGDYKITVTLPSQSKQRPPVQHDVLPRLELWHPPLPSVYSDEDKTPLQATIPPHSQILLELHSGVTAGGK
jgi:hypothetical protein